MKDALHFNTQYTSAKISKSPFSFFQALLSQQLLLILTTPVGWRWGGGEVRTLSSILWVRKRWLKVEGHKAIQKWLTENCNSGFHFYYIPYNYRKQKKHQ